ncbi:hypothetical protein VA7868_02937 [Vibrio aerogenes CECT 7868]|uniref:Uncharacterized protein n=1 Tax=Vibrio aerogenes CECT 7868 TaxID=1216006 RepID=A0A1M5ZMJ9_9VIBR|nr:hypothetical protein [Vibrio aerogenes]SHI25368.1 hypothetical protein VA7868_02937 [Vibrio aerogenes CECT 7868]
MSEETDLVPETEQASETETHSDADKQSFVAEINQEFDPDAAAEEAQKAAEAKAQAEDDELTEESAEFAAMIAVGGLEKGIQTLLDKRLEIGQENAEALTKYAAPLILKYGNEVPPWLAKVMKFKDEAMLSLTLMTVGLSVARQYRSNKIADRIALQAQQEAQVEVVPA